MQQGDEIGAFDKESKVINDIQIFQRQKKGEHILEAYNRVGTASYTDMLSKPSPNNAFHRLIIPLLFHVPMAGREKEE